MTNDSKQASLERSRSMATAAAELAKSMGEQQEEVRAELIAEARSLEQSARVKDFITIIAIRNVKERLRQQRDLSRIVLRSRTSNQDRSAVDGISCLGIGSVER